MSSGGQFRRIRALIFAFLFDLLYRRRQSGSAMRHKRVLIAEPFRRWHEAGIGRRHYGEFHRLPLACGSFGRRAPQSASGAALSPGRCVSMRCALCRDGID